MIKRGDDFASVSTYSQKPMLNQIQAKPTTRLLRRTVTEKFKAQNIEEVLGYHLTVSKIFIGCDEYSTKEHIRRYN
jgi:hypothetical protein